MGHRDPGHGRSGEGRTDPGHHFELDPRGAEGLGLLAAPAEDERVTPLEPHDRPAGAAQLDEPGVDLGLGRRCPRGLPHVDQLGTGRGQLQQLAGDEPVVDHHVGPSEQVGPTAGEQTGVARSGADQKDRHRGTPGATAPPPSPDGSQSPSSRPPASSSRYRATSRPTAPGSSPTSAWRTTTTPSRRRHHPGQPQLGRAGTGPPGVGPDRQRAPPAQLGQEGPLRGHQRVAPGRRRRRASASRTAGSSTRHSTARAPWPTWGSTTSGSRTSTTMPSGADQPSRSMAALATTTAATSPTPAAGQPGGQVAPQAGEDEIGPEVGQLHPASGRAGGHHRSGGQGVEPPTDQHVPCIGPLGHGRQHQVGHGQLGGGGQVLGRVDGGVGLAPDHGRLHLLHEDALTPELFERDVGAAVPGGLHHHQGGGGARGLQQPGHPGGLPQRQRRAPGGQSEGCPVDHGAVGPATARGRRGFGVPRPGVRHGGCRRRPSAPPSAGGGAWPPWTG